MRAAWPLVMSSSEATVFQSIYGIVSVSRLKKGEMGTNRFVVELFYDCIEESRCGAVRGHNGASAEARHVVGWCGNEKMWIGEQRW